MVLVVLNWSHFFFTFSHRNGAQKRNIEEPISEEWHNHFVAQLQDKTGIPYDMEVLTLSYFLFT